MDWRIFQRSYDVFAPKYDGVFEAQQLPKIDALVAALGELQAGVAVDLGAGTGLLGRRTGWPLVEVDVSREMLRTPPRPRCVRATLERLPFADTSVTTLFSITSLIDFEPEVPALGEWARVLIPGGHLLLSVLKRENLRALEAALPARGFAIAQVLDLGLDCGYVARRVETRSART